MEYKTKKIIWEDNNEPPKNYIWVKSDGNAYEFNHITRQWEKIMSSNGSDSGSNSDSNSNVFFQLATIQPNRYIVTPSDGDTLTLIDIENLDFNAFNNYTEYNVQINFFYSKEELTKLGFSLEQLEALETFTLDNPNPTQNNAIRIDSSIIRNNFIISGIRAEDVDDKASVIGVGRMVYESEKEYYIMRYAYGDNNNYVIIAANGIG